MLHKTSSSSSLGASGSVQRASVPASGAATSTSSNLSQSSTTANGANTNTNANTNTSASAKLTRSKSAVTGPVVPLPNTSGFLPKATSLPHQGLYASGTTPGSNGGQTANGTSANSANSGADVRKSVLGTTSLPRNSMYSRNTMLFKPQHPIHEELKPVSAAVTNKNSTPDDKRNHIAKEILTTERTYVEQIHVCVEVFLKPLMKSDQIPPDKLYALFSNIQEIWQLNCLLLAGLEERMDEWTPTTLIGDKFLEFIPFLKLYSTYACNYNNCFSTLDDLEKNVFFTKFLQDKLTEPKCKGLNLPSFLILPVQRLPRYKLLLEDFVSHTPPTHPDYGNLVGATNKLKEVAAQVNDSIRLQENGRKLLEIQQKLSSPLSGFNLVEPHRVFLREGQIWKRCRKTDKKRTFFLFNDILIYDGGRQVVLQLEEVKHIEDIADTDKLQNAFSIASAKKSFVAYTETPEEKNSWVTDLQNAVKDIKSKKKRFIKDSSGTVIAEPANDQGSSFEAPVWQPDGETRNCVICDTDFGILNRRHHCRLCGKVVCGGCSKSKLMLPSETFKQRVCDSCFQKQSTPSTSSPSSATPSTVPAAPSPALPNPTAATPTPSTTPSLQTTSPRQNQTDTAQRKKS